jgi:hypothetical protein
MVLPWFVISWEESQMVIKAYENDAAADKAAVVATAAPTEDDDASLKQPSVAVPN